MGIVTQEEIDILKKNIDLYYQLVKHQYVKNYTKEVYRELIQIYEKYITKNHSYRHWCSDCRAELVRILYTWYIALPVEEEIQETIINTQPKKRGRKPKTI